MSEKKNTAGSATSTAAEKENLSISIITSNDEKVKEEAIEKLTAQDKEAKYDKYGAIMHSAVLEALCEFCHQNAEFARAIIEPDKPFYTVEVSNDGIIRQCYGYKNNRAKNPKPDEIKAFEAQFQNYLNTEVMKHERTQRKLQQGA